MASEVETEGVKVQKVEFNLSMNRIDDPFKHPDLVSGAALTATVYNFGNLENLSIGQLVMALCLARASELEAQIITLMETMNTTSAQLEALTEIEEGLVKDLESEERNLTLDLEGPTIPYDGEKLTYYGFLHDTMGMSGVTRYMKIDDLITEIETKMDELNSFSQQTMIELQSLTNKRDQSYDMISNILKSLHTTLIGNVNNM